MAWSHLQVVSAVAKLAAIHILCKLLTKTIYYPVDCREFHLKWQIFFFLIPFWRQPNWKKFITRLLFVTCHSEANKTLFIFFNPSHSGSKNRSRGRSNWNNTYCLLPFTADLISVLPPCTRAKYTAYLGFYLVGAQKNCVEIKMAWVPRQ